MRSLCSIEGCSSPARRLGWCNKHHLRWRRHGDPLGSGTPGRHTNVVPVEERFWANVDRSDPTGCWPWTGHRNGDGYGQVYFDGKNRGAHRLAWFLTHGTWPTEDLDHTCHNKRPCNLGTRCPHRACCNPDHIEEVTRRTNTLRGEGFAAINAVKTHCPQGHALSGSNLGVGRRGQRYCKFCLRIASRARRARLRGAGA